MHSVVQLAEAKVAWKVETTDNELPLTDESTVVRLALLASNLVVELVDVMANLKKNEIKKRRVTLVFL